MPFDSVRATAIWAINSDEQHDQRPAVENAANIPNNLFYDPAWNDIEGPVRNSIALAGGVGLRPSNPIPGLGMVNVMAIRFTIFPLRGPNDGTWEQDGIRFDATRQAESRFWAKGAANDPWQEVVVNQFPQFFPANVELPNDDPQGNDEVDESIEPTVNGNFYSMDAPGFNLQQAPAGVAGVAYRMNFYEWLRVQFDNTAPVGDDVQGSRVSFVFDWHMALTLETIAQNFVKRTTGDLNEGSENEIEPGHIMIGPMP